LAELGKRSAKLRLIAFVSLRTGMRAGEIFDMRWQDVNFDHGIINVRGKGAISRQAYMTADLARALWEWPRGQSGYVFEDRKHGGRIREVSGAFDQAVKKVGLNDRLSHQDSKQRVVFHTLRHTFASWLALAGCDIFTIKELMGHSNIEMTMRYAHLIPDQKRRFVELVGHEIDWVWRVGFPHTSSFANVR
jgi:integrase